MTIGLFDFSFVFGQLEGFWALVVWVVVGVILFAGLLKALPGVWKFLKGVIAIGDAAPHLPRLVMAVDALTPSVDTLKARQAEVVKAQKKLEDNHKELMDGQGEIKESQEQIKQHIHDCQDELVSTNEVLAYHVASDEQVQDKLVISTTNTEKTIATLVGRFDAYSAEHHIADEDPADS